MSTDIIYSLKFVYKNTAFCMTKINIKLNIIKTLQSLSPAIPGRPCTVLFLNILKNISALIIKHCYHSN